MGVKHFPSFLILGTAYCVLDCMYEGTTVIVIYGVMLHKILYCLQNLCSAQLQLEL